MSIILATDGSALAYANCGGWAYIRKGVDGDEDSHAGFNWRMGSNQSELWAILKGLDSITQSEAEITVYTDSHYVINGVKKQRHSHLPLWSQLYNLLQIHKVSFVKVGKGRSHPMHTRAHHMAREAVFNAVRRNSDGSIKNASASFYCTKELLGDMSDAVCSRGSLSNDWGHDVPNRILHLSG